MSRKYSRGNCHGTTQGWPPPEGARDAGVGGGHDGYREEEEEDKHVDVEGHPYFRPHPLPHAPVGFANLSHLLVFLERKMEAAHVRSGQVALSLPHPGNLATRLRGAPCPVQQIKIDFRNQFSSILSPRKYFFAVMNAWLSKMWIFIYWKWFVNGRQWWQMAAINYTRLAFTIFHIGYFVTVTFLYI